MTAVLFGRPALLFLPASRAGAIAKARASAADVAVLDLEDAVKAEDKEEARGAAVAAVAGQWPMPVGIRINIEQGGRAAAADCLAVAASGADFAVVPKVEETGLVEEVARLTGKPVLAMIETPFAVLHLREIVAAQGLAGLIAGTNDLAAELRLPGPEPRAAMSAALQMIVCAARARGIPAWDGVFNRLDDPQGFAAEATESRALGFDGKSLIHPDQIAPCQVAFAPGAEELARAERLVAAASGGAERFEGAMIEEMHVEAARRLLERRA
jgi:(3S)-malyl-CoA thioesterase